MQILCLTSACVFAENGCMYGAVRQQNCSKAIINNKNFIKLHIIEHVQSILGNISLMFFCKIMDLVKTKLKRYFPNTGLTLFNNIYVQ